MISIQTIHYFKEWRTIARQLLLNAIPPELVSWQTDSQSELFNSHFFKKNTEKNQKQAPKVSQEFIDLAKAVSCYRSDKRWAILYRTLWRLTHGEPYILKIASDDDIHLLRKMEKEVRRDCHKMKAFVRFRKVSHTSDELDSQECYIAWHQPSHFTLERTAPFFVRRFTNMNWAILTPDRSAYWDGIDLCFGVGLPRHEAPKNDEMETLWKTFYWNIFNPARIKVNMMKSEMPIKFWHTLPEAQLIPDMLNTASQRVEEMVQQQKDNLG